MNYIDLATKQRAFNVKQAIDDMIKSWQHEPDAPKIQFARMIREMSRGSLSGEDKEFLQECAQRHNVPFDAQRVFLPFDVIFSRDLTKATGSAGGFLAATNMQESVDLLRPFSVTARMGIEIEMGLVGDQSVPRTTSGATPNASSQWFPNEASGASNNSMPTLALTSLTPKTVGIALQFSRQFSRQTNAETWIRREFRGNVGSAIDRVCIAGASVNAQPLGVTNTPGITSMAGAALSGASANQMKQFCADANAPDEQIAFLAPPAVRRVLEAREKASGSGFVWQHDQVSDRAAYVSTDVPAGTLICGPWPTIYLGIWGAGLILEINPYDPTGFKQGIIQARMLLACDVAVRQPGAFTVATSVT